MLCSLEEALEFVRSILLSVSLPVNHHIGQTASHIFLFQSSTSSQFYIDVVYGALYSGLMFCCHNYGWTLFVLTDIPQLQKNLQLPFTSYVTVYKLQGFMELIYYTMNLSTFIYSDIIETAIMF